MKINFLDPRFLAQLSHVLAGWAFTTSFYLYGPAAWFLGLVVALEVGVLLKESLLDPNVEHDPPQPFFWEGVRDWTFWQPGISLTFLLLLVAHRPI